jgi:hypothetical protein
MKVLEAWQSRPAEEANHFNPAFCGALVYEFCRSYEKAKGTRAPIILPYCALPIALHSETRHLLPRSTVTGMFAWLELTPKVRVGFSDRAKSLAPYIREALLFSFARGVLNAELDATIVLGKKRASFGEKFLESSTEEVRQIVEATRMIGRWFAAAGHESTVMAAWGVKP